MRLRMHEPLSDRTPFGAPNQPAELHLDPDLC